MKKILMGSVVLTALSLSIIAFQMSCTKTANAQSGGTTGITQLGKIIYTSPDSSRPAIAYKIWIANYDGTNTTQVKVSLPSGSTFSNFSTPEVKLSPDGKTLFISDYQNLYSVGVGGGVLTKIPVAANDITLQSAN